MSRRGGRRRAVASPRPNIAKMTREAGSGTIVCENDWLIKLVRAGIFASPEKARMSFVTRSLEWSSPKITPSSKTGSDDPPNVVANVLSVWLMP